MGKFIIFELNKIEWENNRENLIYSRIRQLQMQTYDDRNHRVHLLIELRKT